VTGFNPFLNAVPHLFCVGCNNCNFLFHLIVVWRKTITGQTLAFFLQYKQLNWSMSHIALK